MRPWKYLTAFFLATAISSMASPDPRYRSYGPVALSGQSLPYRTGTAGYSVGSDYIIVGKLDGKVSGPYKNKDAGQIARAWGFLRSRCPSEVSSVELETEAECTTAVTTWCGGIGLSTLWKIPICTGIQQYRDNIDTISAQSEFHYMDMVLRAQYDSETLVDPTLGMSLMEHWMRQ